MITLAKTAASTSEQAKNILKQELEALPAGLLPLEQGAVQGGMIDDSDLAVSVLSLEWSEKDIRAKVGLFFTEIVAGCSCGNEPVGDNAYCEMMLVIDRRIGATAAIV